MRIQKGSGSIVHQACNLDCRLWSNREMPSACKKLHISLISERNSIYCSQLSRCILFLLCQNVNWNGNFSYCYDGKYRFLKKKYVLIRNEFFICIIKSLKTAIAVRKCFCQYKKIHSIWRRTFGKWSYWRCSFPSCSHPWWSGCWIWWSRTR